jgi:cell division protein FtsN
MKDNGEELLVVTKKTFFLILIGIALTGILIGYAIGYITTPVKQIYIQKAAETEKTVLPSYTPETPPTNITKEEVTLQQKQSQQNEKKDDVEIIKEAEAQDKSVTELKNKKNINNSKSSAKNKTHKRISSINKYAVQLGAFSSRVSAEEFIKKLKDKGINAYIVKEDLYKVRVGYYNKLNDAQNTAKSLQSDGFDTCIKKYQIKQKKEAKNYKNNRIK